MSKKYLPLVSFCVLVLAAGIGEGAYSYRWHDSAELADRVQRLEQVPSQFGDWQALDVDANEQELDADTLRVGGIAGYSSKIYQNRKTGKRLSVLIVCGKSGPIFSHTPKVCYTTSGYTAVGDQFSKPIPKLDMSVWAMRFNPPGSAPDKTPIEVNWAWNGDDGWVSPNYLSLTFLGYRSLYKIYVIRPLDPKDDPSVSFLESALPKLKELFSRKS